jgi:hypothetical protein
MSFSLFVDFVKAEAKKANDPTYGKSAMNYSQRDQKPQDMNQRREKRKSGVAHAAWYTFCTILTFYQKQNKFIK